MTLNEFDKYASEAVKKQWDTSISVSLMRKMAFIPSGFCLINRIRSHLIILVNSYKRAMIKYDGQLSLYFNSESELNNALLYHNQYFEERYGQYHASKAFAIPQLDVIPLHYRTGL